MHPNYCHNITIILFLLPYNCTCKCIHAMEDLFRGSPCGKINVIMTLTFYPLPSLNVTAFQHRFNTETLILLHAFSVHTFGIDLYSTVLAMSSWIHLHTSASLSVFCLPVELCAHFSYVVLDTAVTKMQILTLLEVCLDLFNHNTYISRSVYYKVIITPL